MFADLVRADGADAYLLSYEKLTVGTTKMCNAEGFLSTNNKKEQTCPRYYGGPEESQVASKLLNDGKPYVIQEDGKHNSTYSCTCLENWNRFPIGPEKLGFSIFHAYQTSELTYSLRGASGTTASKADLTSPTTTIRRMKMHSEPSYDKEFSFSAGTEIELPVMELIWMAAGTSKADRERGINPLDQPISVASGESDEGVRVTRRVAGTT
jgi:hypothetical protein